MEGAEMPDLDHLPRSSLRSSVYTSSTYSSSAFSRGFVGAARRGGVLGRLVYFFIALVIIVLIAGAALTVNAMRWQPTISFNPHEALREITLRCQPDEGKNGWPLFTDRIEPIRRDVLEHEVPRIDARESEYDPSDYIANDIRTIDDVLRGPWGHPTHQPGLHRLAELRKRGYFDLIIEAVECPRFFFDSDIGETTPIPDASESLDVDAYTAMRHAAIAMLADARRHAEEGRLENAADRIVTAMMLGRKIARSPFLITRLIAISILDLAMDEATYICHEWEVPNEVLDTLARGLPESGVFDCDIANVFDGERVYQRDAIQRIFTDDGDGDGWLIISAARERGNWALLYEDDPELGVYENPRAYLMIRRAKAAEYYEAITVAREEAYRGALAGEPLSVDTIIEIEYELMFQPGAELFNTSLPTTFIARMLIIETRADAFRLALEIERFRNRYGAPPDSLDENSTFADAWPVRNILTQEPVYYHRLDEPDEFGREHRLALIDPAQEVPETLHEDIAKELTRPSADLAPHRPEVSDPRDR